MERVPNRAFTRSPLPAGVMWAHLERVELSERSHRQLVIYSMIDTKNWPHGPFPLPLLRYNAKSFYIASVVS
jgi:hypothetical protein